MVTKVNGIDTTNFVLKTKYEKDGSHFEDKINKVDKKIPNVSDLVTKSGFNAKITEVEGKIPNITGLAASSALTVVENKIPDVNNLVKKVDYDTKTSDIKKKITDHDHDKYITTPEFNTTAVSIFKISTSKCYNKKKTSMLSCLVLKKELLQVKQNIFP